MRGLDCSAKPITHAFIHFKNDDGRNNVHQISEHVEKRITRKEVKDIRDQWTQKKDSIRNELVYVKYCIHVKHNIPLDLITTNCTLEHVSVKGQIVVKMSK